MLQFGHGVDDVEDDPVTAAAKAVEFIVIQFGHGVDAVEDPGGGPHQHRVLGSFNSATALMPWKTGSTHPRSRRQGLGFNSATALMPWKTWLYGRLGLALVELQFGHGVD